VPHKPTTFHQPTAALHVHARPFPPNAVVHLVQVLMLFHVLKAAFRDPMVMLFHLPKEVLHETAANSHEMISAQLISLASTHLY
jgi:hypothetical protein